MSATAETSSPPPAAGRAYLLLSVTTLCWGGNAVFSRLAVGEVSPMLVVSLRWLGVVLLLALFAHRQIRADWPALRQRLWFIAALATVGFTAFNTLFYNAAYTTTAVNIGIIQGSIPVFVLIIAFALYRNRAGPLQLAGVALTLLGVIVVASGGSLDRLLALRFQRGDLLMVLACLCYAGYTIGLRRRPPTSALGLFALMAAVALLTSLPLAAFEASLGQMQWPTPKGWLVIGLITLFPSFLAQICFINGVTILGPARAGVFVNLVPVFASLLAVLILDEAFRPFHALALTLVLGGIWLSERSGR